MKHISTLYTSIPDFDVFLTKHQVERDKTCIARVVTSDLSREGVLELIEGLKGLLPKIQIIGMTSSTAVIHNSKIEENRTYISMEFCDTLRLSRNFFTYKDKDTKILAHEMQVAHSLSSWKTSTVNILINSGFLYITELLAELNKAEHPIPLVGAVVGILPGNDEGFVFDEHGLYDNVIATFYYHGENARHYISTNVSYEVIQEDPQEITKIDHDRILEVDGVPANEWIYDYLGIKDLDFHLSDELLTHFPIVLEDRSSSRFLHFDPDTQGVYIHHETSLPLGMRFKKGCISPNFTVENTQKSLLTLLDKPVESMFLCACFFRKIYLSNCIQWELNPFGDINVCGMFAMGEIVFANGKNHMHHGASIFTGIAEYERYIMADLDKLYDNQLIDTAIAHLSGLLEQAMPHREELEILLKPLEKRPSHLEETIDQHLQLPNMIQYKRDMEENHCQKVCIIEVESADAIIAFLGIDLYYELCLEAVEKITQVVHECYTTGIRAYCFNYKTIFFTCTDDIGEEEFVQLCSNLHEQFEHTSSDISEATFVLRFVLLSQAEALVEDGIKFLFENRNNTETFLVCQNHSPVENSDIHMANVIKWALDHDKIIPYYQGMYHNDLGSIDKYEALMRMEDSEGKIYTPYHFMDIAKKYNLYQKISLKMIERVLRDFSTRSEKVSINLSLSDVQSEHFRSWFLFELRSYHAPENLTIEILESDDFKENQEFSQFLNTVRDYGCKIAVDDFGTGYSTFMTVSNIEPDYIKIDGSVIANIATDEKSRGLLDAMAYFAKKMNALTVAEFVENKEIQDILLQYGITYSQGYHFSKPAPFASHFSIETVSES